MNSITPYEEALQFIKQNPGTSGAGSLAKLILSLYNDSRDQLLSDFYLYRIN